jgi:hypothetical protein
VKLLSVLQGREFERLDATRPSADQLITSRRDLKGDGQQRSRACQLNVISVFVPPRDRSRASCSGDHFLIKYAQRRIKRIAPATVDMLVTTTGGERPRAEHHRRAVLPTDRSSRHDLPPALQTAGRRTAVMPRLDPSSR